jgi:hypothetical protein
MGTIEDLFIFRSGQRQRSGRARLLVATAMSVMSSGGAFAADTNEVLLKKLQKMEQRIQLLETELKQKQGRPSVEAAQKPAAKSASIRGANAVAPSTEPKDAQARPEAQSSEKSAKSKSKDFSTLPPLPSYSPDKPILGLADSPVPA